MIDTFEVIGIDRLRAELNSLGNRTNIEKALKTVFGSIGRQTKNAMSGFFSTFTGETKAAVKMTTPITTSSIPGRFTIMEIGIAAGALDRDKAFFQNYGKQAGTKSIPSPEKAPEFAAWVRAKFSGKYKNEREFRRIYFLVTKSIAKRQRLGKFALERAELSVLMPELDAACADVLNYLMKLSESQPSQSGVY